MGEHARVTGPVTGGSKGWIFGGTMVDIASYGYVEEEFFLDGTATRFRLAGGGEPTRDGRWEIEAVEQAPYRTRIVVLRPEDPASFNGTALVCWNNVTAGYDGFSGDNAEILEGGYAHVAVTCQKAGAHGFPDAPQGLTAWDPERYGSISIVSDDYSFDIFTQAGRAAGRDRPRTPVDPMGGLDVHWLIAYGASQSAGRLATYVNAIQPVTEVYDGFLLSLYFGSGSAFEVGDTVLNPLGSSAPRTVPRRGANFLRDDLDVPVMVVNSELEAIAGYASRQPDTDRYRLWETAGTSHISRQGLQGVGGKSVRDFGVERPDIPGINEVNMAPVSEAAMRHLHVWVSTGTPPPPQRRIEFAGDPPEVVRDEHRIARGGIRLPQVEVPVAHNGAITDEASGYGFLAGSHEPFPPEKVRALYGDVDTYVERFEEAARAAEKSGAILPRDVDRLVEEARAGFPLD